MPASKAIFEGESPSEVVYIIVLHSVFTAGFHGMNVYRRSILQHWRVQFPNPQSVDHWALGVGVILPFIPFGYVKIAIENGDLEWSYPLNMVIFHSYVNVYQRVSVVNDHTDQPVINP